MEGVEYPSKPLQGVDAYDIATFDEGVEFCAKISIQPIPGKAAFFGWLQTYKCILKEGR